MNGDNDNLLNKIVFAVQQEMLRDKALTYVMDLLQDDKAAKLIEKGETIEIPVRFPISENSLKLTQCFRMK